jgi:hypothetical protein
VCLFSVLALLAALSALMLAPHTGVNAALDVLEDLLWLLLLLHITSSTSSSRMKHESGMRHRSPREAVATLARPLKP